MLRKEVTGQKEHDSSEVIINNLLRLHEALADVMEETRLALNDDKVDDKEKEKSQQKWLSLKKRYLN